MSHDGVRVYCCWCVPENELFVGYVLPCSWPDCSNGSKPDPAERDLTLIPPSAPPVDKP